MTTATWSGAWVTSELGLRVLTAADSGELTMGDLVGLAIRRNPKRAHLLVSAVLGKHIPTDPRVVYGAGRLLGALVADELTGHPSGIADSSRATLAAALRHNPAADSQLPAALLAQCDLHRLELPVWSAAPIVLGYAETATGLGHAVADSLLARYVHSTRRDVPGVVSVGDFTEDHSHATNHAMLAEDRDLLAGPGPLVMVDDELSTGQTILNTIAALQLTYPRSSYVVAALVDLRSPADQARMVEAARALGVRISVVALAHGGLEYADDSAAALLHRGTELAERYEAPEPAPVASDSAQAPVYELSGWPVGVREGGRHGFSPADSIALDAAAQRSAREIASRFNGAARTLVLGTEELMYAPLRLALALQPLIPDAVVRYSTTTRSPVLAIDDDGYAIRTRLQFPATDEPDGQRYAYNVAAGRDHSPRFDQIVLVVDDQHDRRRLFAPGGLVAQLRSSTSRVVIVWVPTYQPAGAIGRPLAGPDFGSYRPDEVTWLLKDLSRHALEAPTEDREEAIQAGVAHYAESLPIEYQPSQQYQELYRDALVGSAAKVAQAVGVVTELVLAARGPQAVLVSLARAGTPVGVLMRRWAQQIHGIELPHYAVSIVRGRGIDQTALRYLAARHDSSKVMFVDGWTGKGAITRELTEAIRDANRRLRTDFSPDLAVLADTGHCVSIFGTRADYLIPSACLNSTVSGLVSRTVLNDTLIGPGEFHGAKFYRELAAVDVSNDFLDAVSAQFDGVRAAVAQQLRERRGTDDSPSWRGWSAVEELGRRYGIADPNLIKPGVGETTRVLLRRVPWKVLIRSDQLTALGHIELLAAQRGVEIELVDDLAYSCVGLIAPNFSRRLDVAAAGAHR